MKQSRKVIVKNIDQILDIGIALSAEKSYDRILEMILEQARSFTKADAGTLYLCEGNSLIFKVLQNDSMDIGTMSLHTDSKLPVLPINKKSAAGYAAISGEIINISDVYNSEKFDFAGPKLYDKLTGYKTISMLVVPLKNSKDKVLGVLQIINARDDNGNIIPFTKDYNKVISSLASQAAITLTNIWHVEQIKELMHSFVESMATAIDARTPYNASHTKRVAKLVEKTIEIINTRETGKYKNVFFDQERKEQLIMAAWLHDIGKIGTPLSVLNKGTKLGDRLELIIQRMDYIKSRMELDFLKKGYDSEQDKDTEDKYNKKKQLIQNARALIKDLNEPDYNISVEDEKVLREIVNSKYIDEDGKERNWISKDEFKSLTIKRGTLTAEEREMVEKHVEIGLRILENIPFPDKLAQVPEFVSMHHELLDGSGYPAGLRDNEIPLEARILAVIDIFDALTSYDRPYRKASSIEENLEIMKTMVEEGKLDGNLFSLIQEYKLWEYMDEYGELVGNFKIG
ncbi:MAG: HD domain-containing phosphohydrolase [Halanaerobiales bacterium]